MQQGLENETVLVIRQYTTSLETEFVSLSSADSSSAIVQ